MKIGLRFGLLAVLVVASVAAQASQAWRWKENGLWVYGDHYPSGAQNPELVGAIRDLPADQSAGIGNDKAAKLFPVVVYGVGCPGCEAAKKILESRKIPVTIKDPSQPAMYEEFKKYSPQSLAPVIMIGEKPLVGFDSGALNGALDDAGYDKVPGDTATAASLAPVK